MLFELATLSTPLLGIWRSELGALGQAGRFLLILAVGPTLARLMAGRMQEQATP